MKPAELRVHIRQLCCLGMASEQLVPTLLKAVRQLVGADSAGFFWVDARGDMTRLYAERMLPASAMKLYFERYYDSDQASFRRAFVERANAPEPVTAVTASAAVERSSLYNDVYRPLEAHHVLYGVVREQGEAIGQLSLYRPKSAPPFSAAQRGDLASIMRYVGHGLARRARSVAALADMVDTEDDAVLLIAADGSIRQMSSAAQRMLMLATHESIGRVHPLSDFDESSRELMRRLADRLRSVVGGGGGAPPSTVVDNAWGRFVLRAYAIGDSPANRDDLIAIRIHRQEPLLLKFVDALSGQGLSPQQREVAVGIAKGMSNQQLAEALGVSANTVAYHVKQLFQRLDTHDRDRMIARVLGRFG